MTSAAGGTSRTSTQTHLVMAADHLVPGHSAFTQLQPDSCRFARVSNALSVRVPSPEWTRPDIGTQVWHQSGTEHWQRVRTARTNVRTHSRSETVLLSTPKSGNRETLCPSDHTWYHWYDRNTPCAVCLPAGQARSKDSTDNP
jgi:hypothetical protein